MPKEEKKKMSKKKKWLIGVGVVLVIGFIGGMGDDEEEPTVAEISEEDQAEIDRQQKEHDEKEAAKKEKEEKKAQEEKEAEEQAAAEKEETVSSLEVNETFSFSEYTVTLEDVEIENGEAILNMQFKNDSWPDGLSFMQSVALDVYQGDELLEETSDEYTTGLGSNSGIFYKHDTGIYSHLDLSYGPIEEGEPIRIVFVPLLSEHDESQEITIELE